MNIKNIFQKFHRSQFAYASGIITALAGCIVLLGWLFDSNTLKTLAMGGITVKANAAIAFMLAGLTLILLQRKELRKNLLIARLLAGALTILGSLVILQYIFNVNLGIDEFLFHEAEDAFGTVHPGRLAPNTALNFILIGLLFLSLSYPKYERSLFNLSLLITTFIICIIGLSGYVFGIERLTGIEAFTKMPLAASVIFIILCTGIFLLMFGKNKYTALEYKLIAGLTVAGILIIFVSLTSVTSIRLLLSTTEKVEHTKMVQEELKNVLSEIYGFVANDRGFLFSGNEKFLSEWYGADEKILQTVEKIRTLTKDNPRQQASVKLLDQLVKDRINFSKLLVSTYKTEGKAASLNILSTLKGKGISDKIDRLITEMNSEEERLLLERNEAEKNKASDTLLIILFNLFTQIILLVFIFVFVKRDVSGKRKAEAELQKLNAELECRINERTKELEKLNDLLKKTGELARVGGWEIDLRKNELIWSDMVLKIHEVEPDYQPTIETGINFYAPEAIPVISEAVRRAIEEGRPFEIELPLITAKNNRIWVRGIGQAQTEDGKTVAVTGVFQDITESKKAVEDIKKANRVFAVLSNVNQTIVRVKDKQTLFNEACRIAVDDGKFNMAWIGMVDELTQKIIPVAEAGKAEEYVKTINIDLNDKVFGDGPTGRCIKSGVHYITNDIANDPEMVPWREAALKLGNQSSAAFPIKAFGKTIGDCNIYSDEINFFDEAEVKLLDQMAMDISFAVDFLETESRRK
jgi:CHASE3 domain sensor protein/putative methionine-R-sulfoxide reductase with GAF domain